MHIFILNLVTNLVAGVILALGIYLIQRLRYRVALNKFNNVTFIMQPKYKKDAFGEVVCKVKSNRILYQGYSYKDRTNVFKGEFIMNEINLKFGEGFQTHDTFTGFNFPKMVIYDDNTIYTDTEYLANVTGEKFPFDTYRSSEAYIWNRKKNSNPAIKVN